MLLVKVNREETVLSNDIFSRLENIKLIDKYEAYQLLDNEWNVVKVDLEIIQTEGFEATKKVDPNIVTRKKDGTEQEVQEGWIGRVMPFLLVQENYFKHELNSLQEKENRIIQIASEIEEIVETISHDDNASKVLNESLDSFDSKELNEFLDIIYSDVESDEINILKKYLSLLDNGAKKAEKENYIKAHKNFAWNKMDANKDGTYGKPATNGYLLQLQSQFKFPDDSFEGKVVKAYNLLGEEKELKSLIKKESAALHLKTKHRIENLTDEEVFELLELKWIDPLIKSLNYLPETIITELSNKVQALANKYEITYSDVAKEIKESGHTLSELISNLEGNEFDMKGLNEFKSIIK
jgi:type I restriction enzyme M protein